MTEESHVKERLDAKSKGFNRDGMTPLPIVPEAQPIVARIADELRAVLGGDLLGLYVYGSALMGGFDDEVSDVDMIAVTRHDADELDLAALTEAHETLVEAFPGWADRIEIVYVGRRSLDRFRDEPGVLAVISPGEPLHLAGPVADWLQNWYLVRETGRAVVGPPPSDVLPAISRDEFLDGVRWYARYLAGFVEGERSAGELAYAALSACRAARTIETRAGCSKQQAAVWMRDRRPDWSDVIEEALRTRAVRGRHGFEALALRDGARDLVREVAREVGRPRATGA